MIDTKDMMDAVKTLIAFVLLLGLIIMTIVGSICYVYGMRTNTNVPPNKVVCRLVDGSPLHSIPDGTEIVAACSDDCAVFAYIVKDGNNNHFYVDLETREVKKIEEVNVVKLEQVLCESNRQSFKYKNGGN